MEATGRIELPMEVLQTSALPLGYVALAEAKEYPHATGVPDAGYRDAFARVPAAVSIVAGLLDGGFRGLAASSLTSVSLEPPLLAVALDRFAQTRDAVAAGRAFTVSVLRRDQEFLAERFGGRAPLVDPAWKEVPHHLTRRGLPVVDGAVAWFECSLESLTEAGDHDLALGHIEDCGIRPGDPLLLWERSFWSPA